MNQVNRELWFIFNYKRTQRSDFFKKKDRVTMHTDVHGPCETKGEKNVKMLAGFHWTVIVWHFFLVFCLLCSCLMYPCVNICFFLFLFFLE